MWFGDLVTMRWWDDLWLNESFAEWASHWCNTHATRFTDAWTTFLSVRKNWGYRQDQLSSTHPVYCEMPDVEAVEVNFDGITYAKGASVIKQLVAYVGMDAVPGRAARLLRQARLGQRHLRRPAHRAGGGLRPGAARVRRAVAGDRPGQHAAPEVDDRRRRHVPAGRRSSRRRRPATRRCAPTASASASTTWPTARLVRRRAARGRRRRRAHRADRARRRAGRRRAAAQRRRPHLRQAAAGRAVDGDRGRAHRRLRRRRWPGRCAGRRRGTWSATPSWPPATTSRWCCAGLPAETDINLVTATLRQASRRAGLLRRPGVGADRLGRARRAPPATTLRDAEPGSGFQLAWARAFVGAARTAEDLAVLRGWLRRRRACRPG